MTARLNGRRVAEPVAQPRSQHQQPTEEHGITGRDQAPVRLRSMQAASIEGKAVTTTVTPSTSTNCTRHSDITAMPAPDWWLS